MVNNFARSVVAAGIIVLASTPAHSYTGECRTQQDIDELPAGHWCEVPNSNLRDAEKQPSDFPDFDGTDSASWASYQGISGLRGIINAWNSAGYDQARDRLLIFGGGHGDYAGNEIFAFNLGTLQWQRLSEPSPFPAEEPEVASPDGTPLSRHTYGGLLYLPQKDSLFALGGAPHGPGSCGAAGTWFYDFNALETTGSYATTQWSLGSSNNEPRTACDDFAVLDSATNTIYYRGIVGWSAYNVTTNSWREANDMQRTNRFAHAVIHPRQRVIAQIGGGESSNSTGLELWDLTSATLPRVVPDDVQGDASIQSLERPGLVYDPVTDEITAWHGGTTVFSLDLAERRWTRLAAASGNLVDPGEVTSSGGVFDRFAYSDAHNVYMYVDSVDRNVYLYRLDASQVGIRPGAPSSLRILQP